MKWRYMLLMGLIGLLTRSGVGGQEPEQFRLNDGQDPIEATPLSWDFRTAVLTLELEDGSTREVPATGLHSSDMRRIERLLKKQLLAGKQLQSSGAGESRLPQGGTVGKVDRLHGVNWLTNEADARRVAAGQPGSQDDRPIVWFRVLGDMTGFM